MRADHLKLVTVAVALLSTSVFATPLIPPAEATGAGSSTPVTGLSPLQGERYSASGDDVAAATVAALAHLGFAEPTISEDGRQVNSLVLLKRKVSRFQDQKVVVDFIREARAVVSTQGCSTTLDVSFNSLRISYGGGTLSVGSKTAPFAEFYAAVNRQLRAIQGEAGRNTWLDTCPKPPPLPVL